MDIKNVSKEVIDAIKKWIDEDETNRFDIVLDGDDYYYDKKDEIFIYIYKNNIELLTLEDELNLLDVECDEDDDYADCLIEAIKEHYEGKSRNDLLSLACDIYDKDFFKVKDRW
jgi:hypothetical protein